MLPGVAGFEGGDTARTSSSVPGASGMLIGGLEPCSGIFQRDPPFAAGTIVVFRGLAIPSGGQPDAIVATYVVQTGALYRFTLRPGQYTLVGHYIRAGSIAPWAWVTVAARATTDENIPNRCA